MHRNKLLTHEKNYFNRLDFLFCWFFNEFFFHCKFFSFTRVRVKIGIKEEIKTLFKSHKFLLLFIAWYQWLCGKHKLYLVITLIFMYERKLSKYTFFFFLLVINCDFQHFCVPYVTFCILDFTSPLINNFIIFTQPNKKNSHFFFLNTYSTKRRGLLNPKIHIISFE